MRAISSTVSPVSSRNKNASRCSCGSAATAARLLFDEFRELVGPLMLGNFRFEQLRVRVVQKAGAPLVQIAPKKIDRAVVRNMK